MSTEPAKRILLGIAGGIAAYKAADLCSKLAQAGHHVQVVMTSGAKNFIGETTLSALSGRPVATESFDPRYPLGPHIELAVNLDLMVIAPATASILAKLAHGHADDLLSTLYLQNTAPVLLAPAMSDPMWNQPAVQRNIETLRNDGCQIVGPEKGWLSCRVQGVGRMSEPTKIAGEIHTLFSATTKRS
ncbi:flavoprotein [Rhodopirellula sallentina]|uniref:Phosphopantothenoylcysteine decarboxylase/phosphopantothenate--cysteine ligase n=1 Tax=Rhodopirellula sallentina SM41 TaxID=1263870 RepID=M5UE93_9BACT|nr:flavoprotein [Rhodopirellula sallentina]EMI56176.1 phosphopantothenoylcysteine decarboxylase/phosphopantothenate--cysteine ligase [Rhodopirellula sallentina SM41]